MNTSKIIIALALLLTAAEGRAQVVLEQNALKRATSSVEGEVSLSGEANNGYSPFWMHANQNGLNEIIGSSVTLNAYVGHDDHDKPGNWHLSWGLGVQVDYDGEFRVLVPDAFVDFDYKKVCLSVGSKIRRNNELKGDLTSGSQTFGNNALPVPSVRFELPEYWNISPWIGIKGHFSYGMMTDGNWQKDYLQPDDAAAFKPRYAKNILLHTKAGYLRVGNVEKFPLTLEGGLEMATQFGGTVYNYGDANETIEMPSGIKDFVKAIYSGGSDATDGPYANAGGNTLGSWLVALTYHGKGWKAKAYFDHFFEDHSQMFMQYGWYDGLVGFEVELPENRFVSRFCYEYIKTTDQTGPISHDHTEALPTQISGGDDYYNHVLYQGWQHFGIPMGNPFYFSPLYREDGSLLFDANRFKAHHLALAGTPVKGLDYKLHFSYVSSWGTYNLPFENPKYQTSLGLSLAWAPEHLGRLNLPGWSLGLDLGWDKGSIIGDNTGACLAITKSF